MPSYCTITVHYMDDTTEQYFGGLHISNSVLRIWPLEDTPCTIPLCNIRKIETKT